MKKYFLFILLVIFVGVYCQKQKQQFNVQFDTQFDIQQNIQQLNDCCASRIEKIKADKKEAIQKKEIEKRELIEKMDFDFKKLQENYEFVKKVASEPNIKQMIILKGGNLYNNIWVQWCSNTLFIVGCYKCPTSFTEEWIKDIDKDNILEYKYLENMDREKFVQELKKQLCE